MLNRDERDELRQLRAAIINLQGAPMRGTAWATWYGSVCEFLGRAYGIESAQLAEFQTIRFEPTKVFGRAENIIQSTGLSIEISEKQYYLERLSEADEYLLSLSLPV